MRQQFELVTDKLSLQLKQEQRALREQHLQSESLVKQIDTLKRVIEQGLDQAQITIEYCGKARTQALFKRQEQLNVLSTI